MEAELAALDTVGAEAEWLCEREIGSNLFLNKFWWLNFPTQIIGLTSLL
jgi:hypothetical protein